MTTTSTKTPNTRLIAGVEVPDTPLVRSIRSFLKEYYDEMTWNHVNRSWLLGALIASKTQTFSSPVSDLPVLFDAEIQAISALTHDLAWDCRKSGKNFCSEDKRFEVDCANAAITVLKNHLEVSSSGEAWDAGKLQLVWDAVALHTTPSIASYKEPEVAITSSGIGADFFGANFPGGLITWEEWDTVVAEFPRVVVGKDGKEEEFKDGAKRILSALCLDKPQSTYDNWVGQFGEVSIEGFSLDGCRFSDTALAPIVRK